MKTIVDIQDLSKSYGKKLALDQVSFTIEAGKVVGLLGPNGSGKTTLIKILTGLINNYQGQALVNGFKPGVETKAMISYLPDVSIWDNFDKIQDCLDYYEDFFEDFDPNKTLSILRDLGLEAQMKIKALSRGMKEKHHLAMVLGRNAKLYILDEPIAGVDPVARDEILKTIINNIREDSTMLICTHLVKDIEQIFDDAIFIGQGQIIEISNTEELRIQHNQSVEERYKQLFGGENYARKND